MIQLLLLLLCLTVQRSLYKNNLEMLMWMHIIFHTKTVWLCVDMKFEIYVIIE